LVGKSQILLIFDLPHNWGAIRLRQSPLLFKLSSLLFKDEDPEVALGFINA
jgi:hypothetical protein